MNRFSRLRARCFAAVAMTLCFSPALAQLPPGLPPEELSLQDLSQFREPGANWGVAGDVASDPDVRHDLRPSPGTGLLVNLPREGANANLVTTWEHGDIDLEFDVLVPHGSNSGVYLQGRYELQLLDSWGKANPTFGDLGGIYQRWDPGRGEGNEGFEGTAPRTNAARAPGLWQHFRIEFRAPRFDASGRKVSNARFVRVVLNGVTIHEDVELTGPTRGPAFENEAPLGPIMIQGDHGPIAFRNIRYKRYDRPAPSLASLHFEAYEGEFRRLADLSAAYPVESGAAETIRLDYATRRNDFGLIFDGSLPITAEGAYRFTLACEGGCKLQVGDTFELGPEASGAGWFSDAATVNLRAGSHPIRISYYKSNRWWRPRVEVYVEGPGFERTPLHEVLLPRRLGPDPIRLDVGARPRLLRGFLNHGGEKLTHAIAVGSPGGAHYSYDLTTGTLLQVWRGEFLDVTQMWHERGEPQLAVPLGSLIEFFRDPLLVTGGEGGPGASPVELRYAGFTLDDAGYPAYRYEAEGLTLEDHVVPAADGRQIDRTIRVSEPWKGWIRLATSTDITPIGDATYAVGDRQYYLVLGDAAADAVVVQHRDGMQELAVPVPSDGKAVSFAVRW